MVSSVFIEYFYSILVSSLAVQVYGSRSSAKDFSSEFVCPASAFRDNRIKNNQGHRVNLYPCFYLCKVKKHGADAPCFCYSSFFLFLACAFLVFLTLSFILPLKIEATILIT